jgi:hypothetical protein
MIQGLDLFTDFFHENKNDYVVIGGLATVMIMNDLGFLARATKDIDLVIISKNNEDFIEKLLKFIEKAGYKTKQRTTNDTKHNLFRFLNSEDKSYPEQLELFAIHNENSKIVTDKNIIPIQTNEDYKYLSAILLDGDYYNLLLEHTTFIENLHIATPEVLIPLKIHAYLNLIKTQNAKKHLQDIIRLTTLLDDEDSVLLKGKVKEDFQNFVPLLMDVDNSRIKSILKSSKIFNISKDMILDILNRVYT